MLPVTSECKPETTQTGRCDMHDGGVRLDVRRQVALLVVYDAVGHFASFRSDLADWWSFTFSFAVQRAANARRLRLHEQSVSASFRCFEPFG